METSHSLRDQARAQAEDLLQSISAAETVIVTTIERECEALRAGEALAAMALHTRLCDAAKLYLNAIRAARASLSVLDAVLPGSRDYLEERREAFSALLRVELAILAAEHDAAGESCPALSFTGETLLGSAAAPPAPPVPPVPARSRTPMPVAAMPEVRTEAPQAPLQRPASRRALL